MADALRGSMDAAEYKHVAARPDLSEVHLRRLRGPGAPSRDADRCAGGKPAHPSHDPILSRNGASGKLGAVQLARFARPDCATQPVRTVPINPSSQTMISSASAIADDRLRASGWHFCRQGPRGVPARRRRLQADRRAPLGSADAVPGHRAQALTGKRRKMPQGASHTRPRVPLNAA